MVSRSKFFSILSIIVLSAVILLTNSPVTKNSNTYADKIAGEIVNSKPVEVREVLPAKYKISNVKRIPQLPNYCGPAALSEVLRYWGNPISQNEIGKSIFDRRYKSTDADKLSAYAKNLGYEVVSKTASIQQIKQSVANNVPVIVLQDFSVQERNASHFRVAVGYDDSKQVVYVTDSETDPPTQIKYSDFSKIWAPYDYWAIFISPRKANSTQQAENNNLSGGNR